MFTLFRPQTQTPAAACVRSTCEGCPLHGAVVCRATWKDLVDFYVLALPWFVPFFAGMIIGRFWLGLAVWLTLAILFFGYVEALVLCRHCPAYAEPGFFLRCHANWGLPKIPKFDPRPLTRIEKTVFVLYGAVLFLYNVPFFFVSHQWLLLAWSTLALLTAAWTVSRTQCTRCYHVSCPFNRLPPEARRVLHENYPAFAPVEREGGKG